LLCAFGFIMYWLFTWLFVSSLDSWHDKRDICDDHTHTHTHTSLSCYVLWSKVKVCMSRKTTCIGIWFASCCTLIEGERETHLHFFLIDVINVHRWCTSFFAPDFWTVVKILFAMPQRFSLFISIQFTKFGFLIIIYCLSFCENVSYLTLKIFF
jgi:hypothetical protein